MSHELSSAISMRVKHASYSKYSGQRRHDLRQGPVPNYIDPTRRDQNRVLMEPPPPSFMKRRTEELRQITNPRRRMRDDAALATTGIITFGKAAQEIFEALSPEKQDAAYRAVAQKIADEYGTTLRGLVVHGDETAQHAHAVWDARNKDSLLMSKIMKGSKLQDIAAEVIAEHAPGILRGERKFDRIARGDDPSRIYNRSVRQLHADLPAEIAAQEARKTQATAGADDAKAREVDATAAAEAAQERLKTTSEDLEAAQKRVEEMQGRVLKLEEKETLTDKEVKRLEAYRHRLEVRVKELEAAEQDLQERKARQDAWEKDLEQRETTLSEQAQFVLERGLTFDAEEKELKRRQAAQESREIGFERAVELVAAGKLQLVDGRIRAPIEHHEVLRPVMQTIVGGAIRKLLDIQNRLRNLLARNEVKPELRDEAEKLLGGPRPEGW